MKLFILLLVVTMMAGCGDNEQVIDRNTACLEQAYTWCNYVEGGTGCWYAYIYACSLPSNSPTNNTVRRSLEDTCLDEMNEAANSATECVPKSYCLPGPVPASCRKLWADAGYY